VRSGRVVTLLTDFGEGPYVPSMKGVVLALAPGALLVDITHAVLPGAIGSAAFLLKHSAPFFPKGTIHLAVIDPGVGGGRRAILAEAEGSFFVGPDNGLLEEALRGRDPRVWTLGGGTGGPGCVAPTFHGRDLFAPVVGRLASGEPPERLGAPLDPREIVPSPVAPPRAEGDLLSGEVVWADRFGNLVTNLERGPVEGWAAGRSFVAKIGGARVAGKARTYVEAPPGEPVLLYGSWDTLEIAEPMGDASRRLGVAAGAPVLLERVDEA
jgi:S-adenosylmethionine hydrolase